MRKVRSEVEDQTRFKIRIRVELLRPGTPRQVESLLEGGGCGLGGWDACRVG